MSARVLVVDDSAYTRQLIKNIIEQEPNLEVAGIATDGIDAMAKTLRLKPDIITLDFEMPGMDGFSFLRWLMRERPTPVIMVSSYDDTKTVFRALELGAVDFIAKPTKRASVELRNIERDLIRKLKGIKDVRLEKLSKNLEMLDKQESRSRPARNHRNRVELVAIGSSTGGPAALQIILTKLPADFKAAVVVSQHMPKGFTGQLAQRLNRISDISIREARDLDVVEPGVALICPGGYHMGFDKRGNDTVVFLKKGDLDDKYTPSVDYMMKSASDVFGGLTMGVLLTGMGNDGKAGMVEIKNKGGYTIAESEDTAVVFGMPAEAIKAGAVVSVLPLFEIPAAVTKIVNRQAAGR